MPHLAVSHIAKSFDGNPAVRDISFAVAPGRVLALCGENGAGKSTLMKVLSGATQPDGGAILLDGEAARIERPADAMALGIRTVYQELSLLPHLSVAENMLLGRMPTRILPFVIDWTTAKRIAGKVLADFGFPIIDPAAQVGALSVAQQQIVEIAKALVSDPKILILDEPTAVLSASETEKLFANVRRLTAGGVTVLYISHRLEEVFEIADEVVVLKDGRSVLEGPIAGLDQARLIQTMVGRPLAAIFPERVAWRGAVVLDVSRLTRPGTFEDIDLTLRAGEIVGMFGLVGSGRTEVARAIFGAETATGGEVRLAGIPAHFATPADAVRNGFAMITEDRKGDGLALDASVLDNAGLASFGRVSRFGVIDGAKKRAAQTRENDMTIVKKFRLALSAGIAAATLSAGAAAAEDIKIGMVNLSLCCAYFVGMDAAVKDEAAQYPNVIILSTDAGGDVAKLTADVEDLLNQDVDALIVSGAWVEAAPAAIEAINAAGVPLVMVDRLLKGGDYTSWVGPDNRAIGEGIGAYIVERLKGEGKVAIIRGGPADNTIGSNRSDGVQSKLAGTKVEALVAPGWGEWSADGGFTQMEDMLAKEAEIDAVFCENDSMCLGAQKAIADADKSGDIFITSVDGEKGALAEIMKADGNYGATGLNSSDQIGRAGFHRVMALLAGAQSEKDSVMPSPIITIDNVAKYYDEDSTF